MPEQFAALLKTLTAQPPRRLLGVGAIVVLLTALIGTATLYLNKPAFETLYVGLDRDDVNRMGIALSEAGIAFDVDSSGATMLVESGAGAQARMILAEKGLPASAGAGYELFDNLGSLGLTSFMQEVTRVRVLEGEIARSIQAVDGIKAARVHIVLPDRVGFRDRDRKPTASILVRASDGDAMSKVPAIRHLVAAAVPGLEPRDVTVMDSTGHLLAAGDDGLTTSLTGALEVGRGVETDIEQKIVAALGPHLGAFNYRVSVRAELDTDRRESQETIFDPDSRVERSVQVVRTEDKSTQKEANQNTSVEQTLPVAPNLTTSGQQSAENSTRREETTNFEISSKRVDTVTNGYRTQKLNVSIIVNKTRLTELLGANAQLADIDARIAELRKLVAAAAGVDEKRGDQLVIMAMEFVDGDQFSELSPGFFERLSTFTGTAINAAAFVAVSLIVVFLGVRPLIRAIGSDRQVQLAGETVAAEAFVKTPQRASSFREALDGGEPITGQQETVSPADRLRALAERDSERAVQVLREWILKEAA